MEINELNKKQLVLLTLLITFIVSIATGIVTVSLMQQMPTVVPQTINNVIQKTIEKVTTVEVLAPTTDITENNNQNMALVGDGDAVVSIYALKESVIFPSVDENILNESNTTLDTHLTEIIKEEESKEEKALGEGIIISDIGLILVESSILNGYEKYKVVLDKIDFEVAVLKKYSNGFTILKILTKQVVKDQEAKTEITL
jgi:hypothetical protein